MNDMEVVGMGKTYMVECHGLVREVYSVEADSEEQAMARWYSGDLVIQEAYSVEPTSARVEDE